MVLAALVSVVAVPADHSLHAQPAPTFSVSPTSLDIGPTQVYSSSSQQLRVTNTGSTPLTFTLTTSVALPVTVIGCDGPVAPTASCTAEVVFAPVRPFEIVNTAVLVQADGFELNVPLTLRWAPFADPADPPPPISVDFGAVRNGQSATKRLTIRNWWTVTAGVTGFSFPSGSRYAVTATTCTPSVPSGRSCDVDVTYTPGVHVGADNEVLTMTGPWGAGGAAASEVFPMRATGVASPIISVAPTSLHFGSLQVGTSSTPLDVVVTNTGNAPLVPSAGFDGPIRAEFAESGCDGSSIAPGQQCTYKVVFAPISQAVTPRQGNFNVTDSTGGATTAAVAITTDLLLPLDFDPRAVTFPATPVGRVSTPVNVRVRNYNTVETPVAGYRLAAEDFAVTSFTCSPKMASGAYCDITVVFQPTKAGPLAADIVVFGPFYGTPAQEVLKLSGTGGAPGPRDDVASVRAGATVTIDPRSNDRDPAGSALAVPTIVTPPSVGTAAVGADGIVSYVAPRTVASGTVVTIVYSVCDQQGACSTGTIRITITAIGGLLPATGTETALLLALATGLVLAGLAARRVGQGARVERR